jgi:nucleotide-binding universal stress UspA family protein
MRVVVWISESTWEGCIDRARPLIPADAEVILLHVSPSDAEELAEHGPDRLMGRRHKPPPRRPVRAIAAEEAEALLERARVRLARPARLDARRGRIKREVVAACAGADLLVMARDGKRRLGPPSFGPLTRFVVDHAPCPVLVVWPYEPPGLDTIP